LDCWN